MILDRVKTIELLTAAVLETGEEYSITADNLIETKLVRIKYDDSEHDGDADYFVMAENDYGTQFDIEELSDDELEFFCCEYDVEPIYDIENSVSQLRELLIKQIKSQEFEDGVDATYVHSPDDVDNYLYRVNYIDNEGWINIDNSYGANDSYELKYLSIDDLIKIYNLQNGKS